LIPVTVITGFLGSGKTTLLNALLQHPALADTAVIINEFGEIAIDHMLVSSPAENMVLLDTGCLCCTVRGDLVQTLATLHEKRKSGAIPVFARVLIETTGLADPVPLLQTIVADPALNDAYTLNGVVTTVDAVHGEHQLDGHAESVKQAAVADALLITKTDLASSAVTQALIERLRRFNPGADVHAVAQGRIDPALVLQVGLYDAAARVRDVREWLKEDAHAHALDVYGHTHGADRHDARIRAYCVFHERPIKRAGLVMWLDMIANLRGANLLRMKGLLNVEGDPVVVHAVQTVVHEPRVLDTWPVDDRRSRLVFIGRDIERAQIERTLGALDYSPTGLGRTTVDVRAYEQFVSMMKAFR